MRYKGKQLKGLKTEVLVIPRDPSYEPILDDEGKPTGEQTKIDNDIVFTAAAVMDFERFDILCPAPQPPTKMIPGNPPRTVPNYEATSHQEAVRVWSEKKRDWMILESFKPTESLEWEQVDLVNPETYHLYQDELRDSGFNDMEVKMIIGLALKVNSVDEDKMEEARQRFLQSRGQQLKS